MIDIVALKEAAEATRVGDMTLANPTAILSLIARMEAMEGALRKIDVINEKSRKIGAGDFFGIRKALAESGAALQSITEAKP